MFSEFKIIKSLKWCIELPTIESPQISPSFLLGDSEGNFEFRLEKTYKSGYWTWNYNLYLELKKGQTDFKSQRGIVQAGFEKEQTPSLDKTSFVISEPSKKEIWYISWRTLHEKKLPSDYLEGNWIQFLFSFESKPCIKIHEEEEDKCLQTGSYLNTDTPIETASEDFAQLLDTSSNYDAEIKCGESSIKAHKNILGARSEVFNAMLQSDMQEGQSGTVEIKDMDVNDVKDFVKYLYTGRMPELNLHKAKILYEAGDKYAVRSLMLRCSEYLQDNLSPENVFECFALADAHSDEKLKEGIKTYLLEKKIYLQGKYWSPFCEKFPKFALDVYGLSHGNNPEDSSES